MNLPFYDPLDGKRRNQWIIAPDNFVKHPDYGTLYQLDYRRKKTGFPMVGNSSWRNYRIELEVLPTSRGGFLGVNFRVQPNGSGACNFHFPIDESGKSEAFQSMGIWGKSCGWKLYPESQSYALFPIKKWLPIRIDVMQTFANLYIHQKGSKPIVTFFDLPFDCGGVQFWSFLGSGHFRNLRVHELSSESITPGFDNPWEVYNNLDIIMKWEVTNPRQPAIISEDILGEILSPDMKWFNVESDSRGVVNLSELFPRQTPKAAVFAKTIIASPGKATRILRFTYTDKLTMWWNGTRVFNGPDKLK
jgi:hypothetical protein